jgi:hypothetical protein
VIDERVRRATRAARARSAVASIAAGPASATATNAVSHIGLATWRAVASRTAPSGAAPISAVSTLRGVKLYSVERDPTVPDKQRNGRTATLTAFAFSSSATAHTAGSARRTNALTGSRTGSPAATALSYVTVAARFAVGGRKPCTAKNSDRSGAFTERPVRAIRPRRAIHTLFADDRCACTTNLLGRRCQVSSGSPRFT